MSSARERLEAVAHGYQNAIILLTANRLGVFAALADPQRPARLGPPRTAVEIAEACRLDARALETVLLALVAAEVLEREGEPGADRFALRPDLAPLLLPEGGESIASIMNHHFHLLRRWVGLDEVLRSGEPVPRSRGGRSPQELRAFICGMKDISRTSSVEVAETVDLSKVVRLLDVGGGPATASITFAMRNPALQCVVFDLPEVVAIAEEEIAAAGLADRITTRAGDFLTDDLGTGFDFAYVSNIIHSLSPAEAAALFRRCHAALEPGGTIVVKDFFLADSRTEPASGARFAVNMLVGTAGGKSYTWTETEATLRATGFTACERHGVAKHSGLLVARKIR